MKRLSVAALVLALALICTGAAQAKPRSVPPTSDPAAAQYCLNSRGLSGQPQTVKGVSVVVVCVDNYQFVPGDDNVLPCVGFVDGASESCKSMGTAPAPPLVVKRGTQLLFDVPDPNMHT